MSVPPCSVLFSQTYPFTSNSKEDELMSATMNVTDGLRRTRQLMEHELERSSLTTQMLGELIVEQL